jgi:hypothetical protein
MRKILLSLLLLLLTVPQISFAQGNLSGTAILDNFRSGNTSISQATTQLSQLAGIPSQKARSVLSSLKNNLKIDLPSGGKLLDGIIAGNIPTGDINNVIGMVNNLRNTIANPQIIKDLIGKVATGQLSAKIGKLLGKSSILGKLKNIGDIKNLFKNADIVKKLEDILKNGGSAAEVIKAIKNITELVSDLEALKNLDPKLLVKAIIDSLPSELVSLLGGLENFIDLLTPSIDVLISGSITPITQDVTGSYEISDPEPHDSPVSKDCDVGCATCTCIPRIEKNHIDIRAHATNEFIKHRNWFIDELFTKHVIPAMGMMSSQLTVIAIKQTQMIGGFFDAKHQLETQRLFQQLMAEAHKDYQPSEGLCEIGTNVRSLAASEKKSNLAHMTFANYIMGRQLRSADTAAGSGGDADIMNRIYNFKAKYCNKGDNSNGLNYLCADGGNNKARMNKDIDFTRTIESKLTLDADFTNNATNASQPDKEDVFALSANLFAHEPLPAIAARLLATHDGKPRAMAKRYMDVRAIAAKRSVAQNSFSALVAERTSGDKEVAPFLKKLVSELDIQGKDVEIILGKEPSYFAQMEVLTKDLYQNPVFYTELYDKPANVLRKSAAIRAIALMQERDLYESQLRSEAVLAIMLETMLREEQTRVSAQFSSSSIGSE